MEWNSHHFPKMVPCIAQVAGKWDSVTNPAVHLSHILKYTIQNRNVYISFES